MKQATISQGTRDRRQNVCVGGDVEVFIKIDDENEASYHARLVDISPNGAKVAIPTKVFSSDFVRLRIRDEEFGLLLDFAGEVCWGYPAEDEWLIGCTLVPQIPSMVFERLVEKCHAERRVATRCRECTDVLVLWDVDGPFESAQVVNYSHGGACLRTKQACDAGQLVPVFSQQHELVAILQTKWQLRDEEGSVIGGAFYDQSGYDSFRAMLENKNEDPPLSLFSRGIRKILDKAGIRRNNANDDRNDH